MARNLSQTVEDLVRRKPGMTEIEIAEEIFAKPYQQRVNPICRALVADGRVKRSGRGRARDPYTYTISEEG